jgi:hypothetical protein
MHESFRPVRRRGRRGPAALLPAGLAAAGVVVGWRLLAGTYHLFQNAYLGTFLFVPGAQVKAAYWASVRFAFEQTVLVAAGVGVLASLAILEVGRAVGR